LASLGVTHVHAFRRARVGVLSTGDELVEAPAPLRVGQIRDSNRHTLLGLVNQLGCEAVDLGLAPDDESAIETALRRGIETCDAIVTSGGVSVGDFDFVKVVLDRLASEGSEPMRWMQIAIKPAKPLAFGVIGGCPVFGLPGNPVSSMVSFELFARPALRKMMGHAASSWQHAPIAAIADDGLRRSPDGKIHFVRVGARFETDGRLHVHALHGQASNLLRSMALANALAVVADGDGIAPGGSVPVYLLTL
jgi:molybdopterin molybdotransferase